MTRDKIIFTTLNRLGIPHGTMGRQMTEEAVKYIIDVNPRIYKDGVWEHLAKTFYVSNPHFQIGQAAKWAAAAQPEAFREIYGNAEKVSAKKFLSALASYVRIMEDENGNT